MESKHLKLGALMRPISIHTGAWRYPGAWPDANFNVLQRLSHSVILLFNSSIRGVATYWLYRASYCHAEGVKQFELLTIRY